MAKDKKRNMNSSKSRWFELLSKRERVIRKIANRIIRTIENEFDKMHSQCPNESKLIFYVSIDEKNYEIIHNIFIDATSGFPSFKKYYPKCIKTLIKYKVWYNQEKEEILFWPDYLSDIFNSILDYDQPKTFELFEVHKITGTFIKCIKEYAK